MADETHIILAFLFKRSGKTTVKQSELYLPLSLELGWFTASQAHQFVQYSLQVGLLKKENDHVSPSFDVNTIDIPVGFKPTQTSFQLKKTHKTPTSPPKGSSDLLQQLLQHIKHHSKVSDQTLQKELEKTIKENGVVPEVAALVLGRHHNVDITEYIDQVEQQIFRENEE